MKKALFLTLFFPLSLFGEDKKTAPYLEDTRLGRAVLNQDIHAYRIEMEKLLTENSAIDFYFHTRALTRERKYNIFELIKKTIERSEGETAQAFFQEGQSLLIAINPQMKKKNKKRETAPELAKTREKSGIDSVYSIYNILQFYGFPFDYQMRPADKNSEDLWERNIFPIELEKTELAKAILKEDPEAFEKEIRKWFQGPAHRFISLLHSTTAEGDSLFHLLAKVDKKRENFSSILVAILNLTQPGRLKNYLDKNIKIKNYKSSLIEFFGSNATGVVLAGASLSSLVQHNYLPNEAMTLGLTLQGIGLGMLCQKLFSSVPRKNSGKKIKTE